MSDCIVLVSAGRHPVSGRPRLSPGDAVAIAMAQRAHLRPMLIHAGPHDAATMLQRGLGLGAEKLVVLEIGPQDDPVPALCEVLRRIAPRLVLTGARAETGEGSGMVPYLLGVALALPVLGDCVGLDQDGFRLVALRRMAGGARQVLAVPEGAVLITDPTAPPATLGWLGDTDPSQVSHEPAIRHPDPRQIGQLTVARKVPPPIAPMSTRFSTSEQIEDPELGAVAILDYLRVLVGR